MIKGSGKPPKEKIITEKQCLMYKKELDMAFKSFHI